MEDSFQYLVFFKCHNVLSEQEKKKVERYFQVQRRSGGGECGPLATVADNVYCIAFKYQKDQQEVQRRVQHTVEVSVSDGPLVFIVTGRPLTPSSSNSSFSTAPEESPLFSSNSSVLSNEEHQLLPDRHLSSQLKQQTGPEEDSKKELSADHLHPDKETTTVSCLHPSDPVPEPSSFMTLGDLDGDKCENNLLTHKTQLTTERIIMLNKNSLTPLDTKSTESGFRSVADAPNMRRIVVLGKTGSGKSSVANTIFGEDQFTVCHDSKSAKSPCKAKTKSLNGKEITLIDTPGLFDTNMSEEKLKPEIVKCITECSPGPHAFLIVLQLGRFTEQENDIIKKITEIFSEDVFNFTTIVFTHGDDLQEGQRIKDFVRPNVLLSKLVEKCGGRCHVIDNKYWKNPSDDPYRSNTYQVKEILKTVEKIVKANNGNCYSNEMLQAVEKLKQQEKQHIAQSSRNLSEREINEKAKSRVCDILNKAAGITTGALLGALLGAAVAIGVVVAGIKITANLVGITTGTAAGATTGAAAGTTGITAGGVILGTVASAGAAFGAYKGYQAAEESETPWEAAKKTAEALWSSGKDVINKVEELSTECQTLVKKNN